MTRLLLIADKNQALNLTTALSSAADIQAHHRTRFADARGAAAANAFDAAVLCLPADIAEQDLVATRKTSLDLPVIALLPQGSDPAVTNRLMSLGADLVLPMPVEPAVLAGVLQRLCGPTRAESRPAPPEADPEHPQGNPSRAEVLSPALEVLRDFSQVLGYSLDHRQLSQQFLLKLRELIGVSRIAVFLEPGSTDALTAPANSGESTLPCAAAIGVSADLVECFALSRKSGIGRQLTLHPQILRAPAGSLPPLLDPKILREFEVLGGQVAIPVNDRERTLGVAVLGGRITGGSFSDHELLLVYHLLEELGLAVKNSWLHSQVLGSQRLFGTVLAGITVGAVVVSPSLTVLYANDASTRFLRPASGDHVEFADLPASMIGRLHEVVERGATVEPFFHEMADSGLVLRTSIVPLRQASGRLPQNALLLLEDFTQVRAAQRAEIDASNLKLMNLIARRFAHEIRNSLVPLTTHQQLFDAEINQPEFRESLKTALERETRRIQRFTDQMLLLARADSAPSELAPLADVIRAAFAKSRETAGTGELQLQGELSAVLLRCHRPSLIHAFEEIFLNGLQSSGSSAQVSVSIDATPAVGDRAEVVVRVRDAGAGFSNESAPRATEPFYTTRNTGVGLGLTIARRVIEAHRGRMEISPRVMPSDPDLTIHFPIPR